jgi:hypothetical protein
MISEPEVDGFGRQPWLIEGELPPGERLAGRTEATDCFRIDDPHSAYGREVSEAGEVSSVVAVLLSVMQSSSGVESSAGSLGARRVRYSNRL